MSRHGWRPEPLSDVAWRWGSLVVGVGLVAWAVVAFVQIKSECESKGGVMVMYAGRVDRKALIR